MRNWIIYLLFLGLVALPLSTWADNDGADSPGNTAAAAANDSTTPNDAAATDAGATTDQPSASTADGNAIVCPAIDDLTRDPDTLEWEGKDAHRWEGYEMSFETQLARFTGAQWHGTKIGQIFCVYHSAEKTSFPVIVLFHALALEPSGGKWSKNLGDYRDCVATAQQDCAFVPQQAPAAENPYKEMQEMKGGSSQQELGF